MFARDNPDLVMFMLSLRTELQMRIVMPTVLWHSEDWPFMCMARFETGPNGNPHWHGFAMGLPGPRFERVRADVDGVGDEAPDTASADVQVLERVLARGHTDEVLAEEQLLVRVQEVLVSADGPEPVDDDLAPAVESCSSGGEGPDPGGGAGGADVNALDTRVRAAIRGLVEPGFLDLVEDSGGVRSYVVVPSAGSLRSDPVRHTSAPPTKDQRLGGVGVVRSVLAEQAGANLPAWHVVHDRNSGVQTQSVLERRIADFFDLLVREWNPCRDDAGRWRYRWDRELGAYDLEAVLPEDLTSEGRAVRDVPPPGRRRW